MKKRWINVRQIIDKDKLKQSLTKEDIIEIVFSLGAEDVKDKNDDKEIIFKTICHGGKKYKLYYYLNSQLFTCYSGNCGTFDIYTLIEKIKGYKLYEAILYILSVVKKDVEFIEQKEKDNDLIDDWNWINKLSKRKKINENNQIKVLPESILNTYIQKPNIWLYNQGIDIQTQKLFNVCFDLRYEMIVYPVYTEYGQLIGCKGRTVKENQENRFIALHPYPKSEILYGLNHTFKYIKEKDMVIVVEGEKTIMQLFSWGYRNAISISGISNISNILSKNISDTQFKKILQLNVPVCLALDKNIEIDILKKYIKKFKEYTDVYIIYDKWNKFNDQKASPTDEGKEVWEFLFKNKFKY